jgi:hypothetical protein
MSKARTLVGLDVHATKVVAAVLDVETGQMQFFTFDGETARAARFCEQLSRPVRSRMRPVRPGTSSLASSPSVVWSAWSRHRRRSRVARVIA